MTDFTTDAPMERQRTAPPTREYYAYFGIIFLAALPLSFLTWTLSAARQFALPEKGPIAKAWTQARIITPHIFSA
jgi:hypothetical protein